MKRITALTVLILMASGIIFSPLLRAEDPAGKTEGTVKTEDHGGNAKEAPSGSEKVVQNESGTSLYSLFRKGGPFMWPILMIAATALGFIIERFLFFRKTKLSSREFIEDLENIISEGTVSDVEKICSTTDYVLSGIIKKGLRHKNFSIDRVEKSLSIAGSTETSKLERGLNVLSALGNIAPMLGFLGTASGMIAAFADIAAADQVSASIVAGGIQEALLTTAAGLTVAIPTLLFYNYFVHRIDIFVSDVERISGDLLEKILEEGHAN